MKKFILAIAAATLTATPLLAAPGQSQHGYPDQTQPRREQPAQHQSGPNQGPQKAKGATAANKAHQWRRGDRFDRNRASNYRVIGNPRAYKLQAAPKGYRWVQSGRDAVLVRLSNNIISLVVTGAIR